jgi:hypothetical protein
MYNRVYRTTSDKVLRRSRWKRSKFEFNICGVAKCWKSVSCFKFKYSEQCFTHWFKYFFQLFFCSFEAMTSSDGPPFINTIANEFVMSGYMFFFCFIQFGSLHWFPNTHGTHFFINRICIFFYFIKMSIIIFQIESDGVAHKLDIVHTDICGKFWGKRHKDEPGPARGKV